MPLHALLWFCALLGVGDTNLLAAQRIRCILQDHAGNLWFGTDGDGVCRFDGKTLAQIGPRDGLCGSSVWSVMEDRAGLVWFGTPGQVCAYDPRRKGFTHAAGFDSLREQSADRKLEYRMGDVLLGAGAGVLHYDGTSFTYVRLPPARFEPRASPYGYSPYAVYCTFADRNGNLWFGTDHRGVCRYDGKTFTYVAGKGLDRAAVRCIFQDKHGNLWFGNNGGGAYRYDGTSLVDFTAEQGLGNPAFLETLEGKPGTLARVWTIAEDAAGNLWFGTIDAGAWRYDGKSLTNFTMADGLSSNAIGTIYRDAAGTLYFGTDGGGVCTFNGKSFTPFAAPAGGK